MLRFGNARNPTTTGLVAVLRFKRGFLSKSAKSATYCGRPGGNEVYFSDGPPARLHRECEALYRALMRATRSNGEIEKPTDDTGAS